LGASVQGIVRLLLKDFMRLVCHAFIIAAPDGFGKWLRDFAFRISMNWWVFAIAGILAQHCPYYNQLP
jgi:putative ABC transport system permease protein